MKHGIHSKPNILLIVLDSVRAQNTGLQNPSKDTTPFLEAFAEEATVYEQARAPSIWSLPSHASLFTGEPAHVHGVNNREHALEPGHTIWDELGDRGYSTGLFTSNVYLMEPSFGLTPSFDHSAGLESVIPHPDALTPKQAKSEGRSGNLEFVKASLENDRPVRSILNGVSSKLAHSEVPWISSKFQASDDCSIHSQNFQEWVRGQDGPWAACLNFMDGHLPYVPDEEFDKWGDSTIRRLQSKTDIPWDYVTGEKPWWQCSALTALYDGTILQMDAQIEQLVQFLKSQGIYDDTLVVVTGDHGEGFGEYSSVRPSVQYAGHSYGIAEELLHVPLVTKMPGQDTNETIPDLAALTSFYEVVQSLLDPDSDDRDFTREEVRVTSLERPRTSEKYLQGRPDYQEDAFAVYRDVGDRIEKYVRWGDDELVQELGKSPNTPEILTQAMKHARCDGLLATDGSLRQSDPGTNDIDSSTKDRLEELGYI